MNRNLILALISILHPSFAADLTRAEDLLVLDNGTAKVGINRAM